MVFKTYSQWVKLPKLAKLFLDYYFFGKYKTPCWVKPHVDKIWNSDCNCPFSRSPHHCYYWKSKLCCRILQIVCFPSIIPMGHCLPLSNYRISCVSFVSIINCQIGSHQKGVINKWKCSRSNSISGMWGRINGSDWFSLSEIEHRNRA